MIWNIVICVFLVGLSVYEWNSYRKRTEKTDGVETINGIRYLVRDTDVKYVMNKLGSTMLSKIIKETSFDRINDHEGILTFGGIAYNIGTRGSEKDMNIGAAYRIKCTQYHADVIMEVTFEKRDYRWWSPSLKEPGFVLNQAYHRFFKEVFDVKVISGAGQSQRRNEVP